MSLTPIIFTDLDGTFLNHETYSAEAALALFREVKERGVPVIIVTSKTRSEVELIRRDLDWNDPFIVENGAAILFPVDLFPIPPEPLPREGAYWVKVLGKPYPEIRRFLVEKRERYNLTGFGDMTIKRVSDLTGLSLEETGFAMSREFTEPFVIDGPIDDFTAEARRSGFDVVEGGRFHHLMSEGQGKGPAVTWLLQVYRAREPETRWLSIGLGDSPNDFPLLDAVTVPILIRRGDGTHAEGFSRNNLILASETGPRGWSKALRRVLETRELI